MNFYKSNCVVKIIERPQRVEVGELYTKAEIRKYRLERFNFEKVEVSSWNCYKKGVGRFENIQKQIKPI